MIGKEEELDKLMFDCWRAGHKYPMILELAQKVESQISKEDIVIYFKNMFMRELGLTPKYLGVPNV